VEKKRAFSDGPLGAARVSFSGTSVPNLAAASADLVNRPGGGAWPGPKHARFRKFRSGLTDEQRGLASRYLPMADSLAKDFRSQQRIEREELRSTAYMALVQAARTFDPSRKVNFATFARHRIRGALRDYLRCAISESWHSEKGLPPVLQCFGPESERYGRMHGLSAEKPVGTEIESIEAVESWLARLPKMHALVCRLIYLSGKTQDEVAAMLGYSRSHLSRVHHEAVGWLMDYYNAGRAGRARSRAAKANRDRPYDVGGGVGPTYTP
jgi:RNA polymerase sigma factor (sigma-70 family)